jgi:nitroreductase
MDLACRQFRAFDLETLTTDLNPSPGRHIVSMIAIGRPAEPPPPARDRRTTTDLRTAPWA